MLVFFVIFGKVIKYRKLRLVSNIKFLKRMARAMFEYTKVILKKVSFNSELFCRELEKSLQRLLPFEIQELTIWLKQFTANKPELFVCFNLINK